jgi:signal transduction histidine kinase
MTARLSQLTRPLQIGFLVLLVLCTAQLAWWIIDQVEYTAQTRDTMRETYRAEAAAARMLLESGRSPADISRLYPALVLSADRANFEVSPEVLTRLDQQRYHRLNRFVWEGGFFLVVLLGAMAVVYRTLHAEAVLHRRQEEFLAAVSHELKSPLASLRLSAETLAMRDPPPERRAQLVDRLLDDLGRLDRMISNVLDASRLSGRIGERSRDSLDLAREVARAIAEIEHQAAEAGVTVKSEVAPDLVLRADREAVRTVIRNLLHNALKATRGGGTVRIGTAQDGARVRLTVEDDGIGFPPEQANRLFEKFYRVDGEGRDSQTGTGLGLYLVRRCVELDHGTVEAASGGARKGAVFTVTWPLEAEAS